MKKIKNGLLDILFFYLYHIVFVLGTCLIVLSFTKEMNVFDFEALQKAFYKGIEPKTSAIAKTTTKAKISNIRGQVLITLPNKEVKEAAEGEELLPNSTLTTGKSSLVNIIFGDKYECKIQVGTRTTVNVDEIQKTNSTTGLESSLFRIIKGAVMVLVTNKKEPIRIELKTKHGVFGVRGTKFSILTDSSEKSALVVKEGKVEVENYVSFAKKMIFGGTSAVLFNNGNQKEFNSSEPLNLFDWENTEIDHDIPTMEDVLISMGSPKPDGLDNETPATGVSSGRDIALEEIKRFKDYSSDLKDRLLNLDDYLNKISSGHSVEASKIQNDIRCLSVGKSQCDLYSEKILTMRGFPRTFGSPRLLASLIADLKLYLNEKEAEISKTQEEKAHLEQLIQTRAEVLLAVEEALKAGESSDNMISKLRDKSLIDK